MPSTRWPADCRTASRSSPRRTARRRRPQWPARFSPLQPGSRGTAPARTSPPGSHRRCSTPRTRSSACSRSTSSPCRRSCDGPAARRVARKPLPRPARPLRRARAHRRALAWRGRGARPRRHDRRERRRSARRGSGRRAASTRSASASTTRRMRAPRSSTPRTRSTACAAAARTATTPSTSATSAPTAAPAAATRGRRSTSPRARDRAARAGGDLVLARDPGGSARVRLAVPGLYNVYNALAAASVALALDVGLDDIADGLERFRAAFGRFERFAAGDRRVLLLLDQEPGRRERGREDARGGWRSPPRSSSPSTTRSPMAVTCRGSGTSTSSRCSSRPRRSSSSGRRAAELALRFTYAGFPRERLELVPDLGPALDRGLELVPAGGELVVLPTYTAMLEPPRDRHRARASRGRTGKAIPA